jgi:2,4-dienoyl-CoA reductase-like NADH-dependent reductase (Old Yellow Enzyme family)/thioredoxin reductase
MNSETGILKLQRNLQGGLKVKIFEPIKIGNLELRNRIVMPPMATGFGNSDGTVNEKLIRYYERRGEGEIGLIIVEATAIHPSGIGFRGGLGIWDDRFIPGLKELAKRIKKNGAKSAIQLFHAGRQTRSKLIGTQPVAPSPIPWFPMGEMPRELRAEEIEELVERFGDSARRAREAGFDAVEIHGAHGYLICQFLSPSSNKRRDEWGGESYEKRARFAVECIRNARKKTGNDFPILFRISADEFTPDGLKIDEVEKIVSLLEKEGISAIHVSGGCYSSAWMIIPPMFIENGCYVKYAERIKKGVKIPVIVAGRITSPNFAEEIISKEKADMVSMGRALIADPEIIKKFKEGREDEIKFCIGCNYCSDSMAETGIRCSVNPEVGREGEKFFRTSPKRIMIVGGGPAGLSSAVFLKKKGHDVVLYEKEEKLGGNLRFACIPSFKTQMKNVIEHYENEARRLNVKIFTGVEVTPSVIQRENPDVLILSTGSIPLIPEIKGIERKNVFLATDVLSERAKTGENVVVIGGGSIGCEVAVFLSERGKSVKIVEMMDKWGRDISPAFKFGFFIPVFNKYDVRIITGRKVIEIKESSVLLEDGEEIPADSVVIATGYSSNRKIYEEIKGMKMDVFLIGDSKEVRKMPDAIQDAYEIAKRV